MIKNYIILAIRVLGRKKFFTFISLFGISFTLAILMLILSFLQTELGSDKPWTNKDRMVLLDRIEMRNMQPDTTKLIDSTAVSGVMTYDTTYSYGENSNSTTISSLSARFLLNHYTDLPSVENYTFFARGISFNAYVNNSKIVLPVHYTDNKFWEVLDFEFIEGQGYDKGAFDRAEPVAVITDKIAKEYFGFDRDIVGKEIKMDGINHKVIGLIAKPKSSLISADVFAPSTVSKQYPGDIERYTGGFTAIFLGRTANDVSRIQQEIVDRAQTIPMDVVNDYNKLIMEEKSATMFQAYSKSIIPFNDAAKSGKIFTGILIGFISLFVLLPTLNLINLNVSRIMERSSEIGVRKSFGASKANILGQFVFENVVLTILGGIIGFIIALLLINFINSAQLLDEVVLSINLRFFIYSFFIVILFGILSGLLPAYRMSKLHIVNALKENKL